jgi:hypothetical protein
MAQAAAKVSSYGAIVTSLGRNAPSLETRRVTHKSTVHRTASQVLAQRRTPRALCNTSFLAGPSEELVSSAPSACPSRTKRRSQGVRCKVASKAEVNVGSEIRRLARYPHLLRKQELDIELPMHQPRTGDGLLDVLIVGAGPAGLSVAQRASAAGLKVCCVDPGPKLIWPNNYGVWIDEFEAMGLTDCLDYTWPKARVWLDGADKRSLDRPYGRVNRNRLKTKLLEGCSANRVTFYEAKVSTSRRLDA